MTSAYETLAREIAAHGLVNRHKLNDYHVLSDEVLSAAIEGSHPLNRTEWNALLDSPMTLHRFQVLAALLSNRHEGAGGSDSCWSGSEGILLAADTSETAPSLSTDDGWWRLVFLPAGDGFSMVLQLDRSALFATTLIESRVELVVVDGGGRVIMQGILDEDGELEVPWTLPTAPYAHFMEAGGRFDVRRC